MRRKKSEDEIILETEAKTWFPPALDKNVFSQEGDADPAGAGSAMKLSLPVHGKLPQACAQKRLVAKKP